MTIEQVISLVLHQPREIIDAVQAYYDEMNDSIQIEEEYIAEMTFRYAEGNGWIATQDELDQWADVHDFYDDPTDY